MGHDVFISYSSRDKSTADAVCAALEAGGARCWIAPRDILGGQEYAKAIIAAINQARALVLIFSATAGESPQVLREVERAVSRKVPIVTFKIDHTMPGGSFEYFLGACHWLQAARVPTEAHLSELNRSVAAILEEAKGRGATTKPSPGPRPRRKVPPLLPYMADRQLQDEHFDRELAGRLQRKPAAPVVCVVHGDEDQCHDKFIDRLRHRLPALLENDTSLLTCRLDCRCPAPEAAVLAARWTANLAGLFNLKPGTALDAVSRAIAAGSAPLLIEASFWSTDCRNGVRPLLDSLLNFLETWSFPDGAKVIACISISYVQGRGFFQKFRYGQFRSAMQKHIRSLEDPGRYPRIAPAVLPRLENVSLAHALHWATEPTTRKFCRDDALADRVRQIYEDRRCAADGQTIPMKHLADRLKDILAAAGAEARGV